MGLLQSVLQSSAKLILAVKFIIATFLWALAAMLIFISVDLYLYPDDLGMGSVMILNIFALGIWYLGLTVSKKLTKSHWPPWIVLGLFVLLLLILLDDLHAAEMILGVAIGVALFCQGWYNKKPPFSDKITAFRPASGYKASIKRLKELAVIFSTPPVKDLAVGDLAIGDLVTSLYQKTEEIYRLTQADASYQLRIANFEDYYLPKALKLLEEYAILSHGPTAHLAISQQLMEKIAALLPGIQKVFAQSLESAFTEAYQSFSADVEVLEQMIKLENLDPEGEII